MINNPIIFYIASVLIIGFALIALFAKDVIRSLLAAVMVFFAGALFFYILGSEYNAIIQAAIYGLAVPVIIGLSIMFCQHGGKYRGGKYRGGKDSEDKDSDNEGLLKKSNGKGFAVPYITLLCAGIFILAFVYLVMMSLVMMPDTFHIMEIPQMTPFDNVLSFARGIFIDYVWAFELVSLLLTIVIAGLSMFDGRKNV